MSRLARALPLAAVAVCLVVPAAGADSTRPLLGHLWTTLLETPAAENPFATGNPACVDLSGHTVAPFRPYPDPPPQDFTCTVERGTKIFVAASTWECSSFPGDHFEFGTTEAEPVRG